MRNNVSDPNLYFHAGVESALGNVWWSAHTRRTRKAAENEARRAAATGGRPLIEWWSKSHGLRPGDSNVVIDAEYVDQAFDAAAFDAIEWEWEP